MQKKIFAVAVFALAFAFAFTASAYDFGTSTLRKGSRGAAVMELQRALNEKNAAGLTADGVFGNGTHAAVVAFQTSKGLTPDGLVGSKTKMALEGSTSTSSGALCPNGMTLASNCTMSPTQTAPSQALCPNGMTIASNCMSAPTGQPTNSNAPFSINSVQAVSGYYNTAVGVGQVDKPIANLRVVSGAGGAATFAGLNVSFYNGGTGDYQFIKYAQSVSVWLNGTKVGTLNASEFTQYNSIYSAYIPVSGAILNANSTNNIVLSVTALPTIDSANYSADAWGVDVTSIRYSDTTGVFTYTPSAVFGSALTTSTTITSQNTYFHFASAATAQSIKLTVTRNIGDSNDSVVVGNQGANTLGVTVAKVDLNAQGDSISLRRLPVTLATASGSSNIDLNTIVNTLRLYDANGTELDSQPVASGDGSQTITFQNLNVNIPVNTTQTFTIKADFNSVSGYTAGDGVAVSVTSTNVNNIQAYDSGSNVLNNSSTTTLTGSTTGNNVRIYVNGINVTSWGTPTTDVSAPGGNQTHSTVTYTIPFAVTAFGAVAYVPSTAALATSASATNKIQYCVDATSACSADAGPTAIIQYAGSDNFTANTSNGNYQIPIGQTKNFNLIITYQPASAISTRAQLVNVNWATSDANSGGTWSTYTSGLSSNAFKTPYKAAQ